MKLLVAVDGSPNSIRAVEYATDLLAKLGGAGTLTLVSVHDDAALRHARRFVGKQAVDDYLREMSDFDLVEARELLASKNVQYDEVFRTGYIASEIADAAEQGGFDMIVLGSKGRSALKDLVIGSVAKRVAELARTPVLLVR